MFAFLVYVSPIQTGEDSFLAGAGLLHGPDEIPRIIFFLPVDSRDASVHTLVRDFVAGDLLHIEAAFMAQDIEGIVAYILQFDGIILTAAD